VPRVAKKWIRNASDTEAVRQGYTFDAAEAETVIEFLETFCRQSRSPWAGQPLKLMAWQRDLIYRVYGWKAPNGARRFRSVYLEICKKNGKSTIASGLALYHLLADGEDGAEVYTAACSREQASVVFDEARKMAEASPDLKRRLQILKHRKTIHHPETNSTLRALSAEAPTNDGLNASAVIFDELHQQPDDELWSVLKWAGSARRQPLRIVITTAGESEQGKWFEEREYSEKINRGEVIDLDHIGVVYRVDPADDLDKPATWRKGNPSLGHALDAETFAKDWEEAKRKPSEMAKFKRLRFGIVTLGETRFIDKSAWDACPPPRPLAELYGAPCYGGLDLGQTRDLSSLTLVFPDDEGYLDVHVWAWCPADTLDDRARRESRFYPEWVRRGFIQTTPGNVTDYGAIRHALTDADDGLANQYDLRRLCVDQWSAFQLAGELKEQDGLPVEFLRQGFASLTAPTKELERLYIAGRLRHDNPVLDWNVENAVARMDPAGNVKLDKEKSTARIDLLASTVNALGAWLMDTAESAHSVYNDRGILAL
jgi:phage terminase large subunit-like protein